MFFSNYNFFFLQFYKFFLLNPDLADPLRCLCASAVQLSFRSKIWDLDRAFILKEKWIWFIMLLWADICRPVHCEVEDFYGSVNFIGYITGLFVRGWKRKKFETWGLICLLLVPDQRRKLKSGGKRWEGVGVKHPWTC